jgi:hypothetical protein
MLSVMRRWLLGAAVVSLASAFVACVGDDPVSTSPTNPDASSNDGATPNDDAAQDGSGGDANVDSGPPVPAGNPVWSMTVRETTSSPEVVAVDAAGYIYLAVGFTTANTPFADKTLSPTGIYMDVAVVKLTPDGKQALWAAKIGGSLIERPYAISVDASGVYVSGTFESDTIDAAGKQVTRGTSTRPQGFIAKLNPATGVADWASGFTIDGADSTHLVRCDSVRATASGVAFACTIRGAVTYPGGTSTLTDRTGTLVGTLDPSTGAVTKKQLLHSTVPGNGFIETVLAASVDLDSSGNIYLAGMTDSTQLSLGGVAVSQSATSGGENGFVMKLKPDLSSPPLWFRIFGTANVVNSSSRTSAVRVDSTRGSVYVTGSFTFGTNLGFGDVESAGDGGVATEDDVFLVKFDLQGTPQWQKPFGAEGKDRVGQVDVDPWGRPVMAAAMEGVTSASIDGKALPSGNIFVAAKLDPQDGKALSVTARKASTSVEAYGVASSPANGHTAVAGHFSGTLEFDKVISAATPNTMFLVDLSP